jgi:hypothetical protein
MSAPHEPFRISRREAIRWVLTVAGGVIMADGTTLIAASEGEVPLPVPGGYGTDPQLNKVYQPGELWPLTLTPAQRRTASALCDCIIPADDVSPAASAVGVTDFIDEWVSAPYPDQKRDRVLILNGLKWIDEEARKRFQSAFDQANPEQQGAICRDICYEPKAEERFKEAAHFFKRYRDLTAGGFYTTPEGSKDIGYRGNIPSVTFEGPPVELIKKMGLD